MFGVISAPIGPKDNLPTAVPIGVAPRPSGASGTLYGSEAFEGPDGNSVDPAGSAIITDFQLVPGQTEDADLGLYLDMNSVPYPEGTDPGPRTRKFTTFYVR